MKEHFREVMVSALTRRSLQHPARQHSPVPVVP